MYATARRVLPFIVLMFLPASLPAQMGPTGPQLIAASPTAKISVGSRKLAGQVLATVRVGEDGRVRAVSVIENTTEEGFEPQLVRVLESARFRPAIDATGRLVEGDIEVKVELRQSTGSQPKPVAARPDSELAEPEQARIRRMRCADFLWEWDLLREVADDATPMEFMPRMATAMYVTMRSEAGDYVDAKVWKASARGLRESVDRCRDNPGAMFWDEIFKSVMDQAVSN